VGQIASGDEDVKFRLKKADFDRWVPLVVVLVALSGIVFIALDWKNIKPALAQANWKLIPFALLATAVSYACISLSFAKVSKLLGVGMQTRELSSVGFISSSLNHIVLSGGAAGYSVRFMLMNRHGVTMRVVIAVSILHFYLTALWMITMLPVSMIYLGLNAPLNQTTAMFLTTVGAFFLLGTAVITMLIFSHKRRKKAIGTLTRVVPALTGRDISAPLERFDATMEEGIQAMRRQPGAVVIIAFLVVFDWLFSAAALWVCFRALDLAPSAGQLVSGFVIGTVAGVSSALPGGLGVQEASMTGIFALYGNPVEKAALAAILFRLVYTIIPYLVSLGFYRAALSRNKTRKHLQEEGSQL
jgi:uncharacterized protein (TIRG00374 family)